MASGRNDILSAQLALSLSAGDFPDMENPCYNCALHPSGGEFLPLLPFTNQRRVLAHVRLSSTGQVSRDAAAPGLRGRPNNLLPAGPDEVE